MIIAPTKKHKLNIMFLPDLHAPAFDYEAVRWAARLVPKFHIDVVVQLGDIADQRIWSRFPADPDFDNPTTELEDLMASMSFLHRLFPDMHILAGNHDGRWIKRAMQAGLPAQLVKALHEIFPYDGWKWHLDNEPLIIDGIAMIHGDEMFGPVGLKASRMGMPLAAGHSHQGRLEYIPMFGRTIWGMECGCLVDEESSAFRYAAKNPRRQWKGVGMSLEGEPHLIPYIPGEE